MYTVLFVCTANICRTPMAKYYLNKLIAQEGLEDLIYVDSAGTWANDGAPAAKLTQIVCEENGLDASGHRSQPVDLFLVKNSDLILCLAIEHKNDLIKIFPHFQHKIFTLKEYARQTPAVTNSVHDPYGKKIAHYRETFETIKREIQRIFPVIKENAREK